MKLWTGNYDYILRHVKTGEEVKAVGVDKKSVCAQLGLKEHQYRVASKEAIYRTITPTTNLTNAELIEILSKRDPDEVVDILVDYSTYYHSSNYSFETYDGLCFVPEDDQLVICAGEFEC